MMELALMRTATGKEDPELPLLQRISSLELTLSEISAQINASQSSSNRHLNINCADCVNQAFMVEFLQRNHYLKTSIIRRDLLGPRNTSNGHETGGNLSFGLMSSNMRFLVPIAMSL